MGGMETDPTGAPRNLSGEVAPKPTAAFARRISGQGPPEFERNFPHRSESRSQNNNKD